MKVTIEKKEITVEELSFGTFAKITDPEANSNLLGKTIVLSKDELGNSCVFVLELTRNFGMEELEGILVTVLEEGTIIKIEV